LISKIILGLLSVIILFQTHQVYGAEELPLITLDFVSGNIIDLDESPQMIRADILIQNYNPQDGHTYMQVTRVSDGEIIKNTAIFPKVVNGPEDGVFGVKILHYIDPGQNEEILIGDYVLRIYSQFGLSESVSTFSIIKSSMPIIVSQNPVEELVTLEEELDITDDSKESEIENLVQSESKIPSWVHEIFVMYAVDETISENELLTALEYLIAQGIINVNSD